VIEIGLGGDFGLFQQSVLDNGIRVITEAIPHVYSVSIGFWFKVGSCCESPEYSGASHFIEHMLFKGTDKRTTKEIAEIIDSTGGELNAFTGREYTCYYARVFKKHLPIAVDLLADMLLDPSLTEDDVQKERGVIIQEIKMYEDSPEDLAHELLVSYLLGGHTLGQSILGTEASVGALDSQRLRRFKQEHYAPTNLVVGVAGNVEHGEVVALLQEYFSGWSAKHAEVEMASPRYQCRIVYKEKDIEQLHLCLGVPGFTRYLTQRYPMYVLDSVLGGGNSSWLFQKLREDRGLAYSTYSFHSSYAQAGLFGVYAAVDSDTLEETVSVIRDEIATLIKTGISPVELERAKEQLKGGLMLGMENTAARMGRISKAVLFGKPVSTAMQMCQKIDNVTLEDVYRVSNSLFSKPVSVVAVGKDAAKITRVFDQAAVIAC
jgi:predicted Zn-dependent peptidase